MSEPLRIVSLIPSATEIVCALGARENLVGVSHECDFPIGVEALPHCCAPKLDTGAGSQAIDREVKQIVEKGLSVYAVDAQRLRTLAPDVIVTQSQCDVCGVSESELIKAVGEWLRSDDVRVVSLHADRLRDVWRDIERVADAIGQPKAGSDLIRALTIRLQEIASAAHGARQQAAAGKKIVCIEWMEPLMAAGHWVPELVELAGGEALLATAGEGSPWIEFQQIAEADPHAILVMPCGFHLPQIQARLNELTHKEGWADLRAVRTGDVYLCNGNHFFNRPGPRLVESAEILGEIFWPDAINLGYAGAAFVRMAPPEI